LIGANEISEQGSQVASTLGGGWDSGDYGRPAAAAGALIVAKEEKFVLDDRPADRSAKLIPAQRQVRAREAVVGIELVVAQILKQRSVKTVGAGLCGSLQQCASDRSKLRVIVAGRDLEFLQRIDIGIDYGNTQDGAVVLGAIQQESVGGELLAVGIDLVATLRIFR